MLVLGAGVLTALITSLGAYLLTARKMSGRITTSSATELWAEAGAIREDYRDQLEKANARVAGLEARVAACEDLKDELTQKIAGLEGQIVDLKRTVTG